MTLACRQSQANHGPLPPLLALLTLITGFVDAVTYLKYGHVFVANMTGNVVFLGFALAGFLLGALAGGWMNRRWGSHRGNLLAASSAAINVRSKPQAGVLDGARLNDYVRYE